MASESRFNRRVTPQEPAPDCPWQLFPQQAEDASSPRVCPLMSRQTRRGPSPQRNIIQLQKRDDTPYNVDEP